MKLRVKLGSQSQIIVFEQQEPSAVRLEDLKQLVARQFQLPNHVDFHMSLNRRDVLSGNEQTLDTFGIVSGDLLHVIGPGIPQVNQSRSSEQVYTRPQPLSSHSSSNLIYNHNHQHQDVAASASKDGQAQELIEDMPQAPKLETSESKDNLMDISEDSNKFYNTSLDLPEINRYLHEPLIIRESTEHQVPVLLSQLYKSANCSCESDALWVAIHTLMLESGFVPSETGDATVMPNDCKHMGYYMCSYDYPITGDSVGCCSVVGVTIGASVIVHGLAKTNTGFKTQHLQLRCADFVRTLSQDAPASYRALDKLSRQFKDTICMPLINELVTAAGFPEQQGFQALPYEAKLRVISFLDATSLCRLAQTCHELNTLSKDKTVWRILYIRAFGEPSDSSLTRNWYELFKVKYHQIKEEQARRTRMIYLDETDPPWGFPGSGILRPIHPGIPFPHIVGGDYDVNPEFTSGILNPLGGRVPTGPMLPQVVIPDPFLPGLGNRGLPGRPKPGHLAGSPFSSPFRGPFL